MSNQAGLGIGEKVHNQEINEYPEDLKSEYLRLSAWAKETARQFGRGVIVKIIDPQSLVGLYKVVRHRVRRYPTVLVDGETKLVGWEALPDVWREVGARLAARGWPVKAETGP